MQIVLCAIDHIQIDLLSYRFIVQRAVPVRNHKARSTVCRHISRNVQIPGVIFFLHVDVPHLQEHQGKAANRISLDHDSGIFPMPETSFFIDIFICQIDTAGKRCFAVDDQYLSVVPVILRCRKCRPDRRKYLTFDAELLHLFRILGRKQCKCTGTVIHQTHLDAFLHLLL